MPVFNGYSYRSLSGKDTIRLLILEPSTDKTAPLVCRIIEHRLSARDQEYSAVSYAWGKRELSEILEIECDGDVGHLRITANVETVLKGLRKRDKPQYLWIDTICFNQDDEVEKAQQIPIMGDIYKEALTVDIWLGPENDMTARIFAFLRKISRLQDVTKWKTQWELAGRITSLMRKIIHHDTFEALSVLLDFFQQPWFGRRWVIQEACLARHGAVHCGKQSIALQSLKRAATCFQRMDISDYPIKVAANMGSQTTGLSMLELLWHFHNSECTEQKDRIAAFRSLARDGQDFRLDYTKSWNAIFMDFASFTYNTGCNDIKLQLLLHLFEFGSLKIKGDLSYPSWVPDWSKPRQRRLPYISAPKNLDTYELYPSSPGRSEKANVVFDRGCLQIHGTLLGIGLQRFRVAFTATLRRFEGAKDFKKQQVRDVIKRLFPCIPKAERHIIAFSILLRTVSQFRHPEVEREKTSKSLGRFENSLRIHHPNLDHRQLFMWLRTLESTLCDFCLVELKPFGQDSMTIQGYGIGFELMAVDDICIPLWSSQANALDFDLHIGALGTGFQLFTMLVVRRNGRKLVDDLDEAGPFQDCKIVGPIICVAWNQPSNDSESMSDSGQSQFADWKHCLPTRIS